MREAKRIYPVTHLDRDGKVVKITSVKELKKRKSKRPPAPARVKKELKHKEFQKRLRTNATYAEKVFKRFLRDVGINFKFQKIIHVGNRNYRYADFYLPALKWIIEIDGKYHELPEQMFLDQKRTEEILEATPGFDIVRWTNQDVIENPEAIFEAIMGRMLLKFRKSVAVIKKGKKEGQ